MNAPNAQANTLPARVTAARGWLSARIPAALTGFLLLVALVNYAGVALGGLPAWLGRFLEALSSFSAVFLGIFVEAVPYLLIGTVAAGLVEEFISREDLVRWIPRQPLMGVIAGSLIGLFFPVCECGVVPFTRRLMRKGVPVSVGIATLLAAPVINPIVIASTLAAFGLGPVFWGRIGLTLLIAILTGLIFAVHPNPSDLLRDPADAGSTNIAGMHPLVVKPAVGSILSDACGAAAPAAVAAPAAIAAPAAVRTPFLARLRRALLIAVDEFFDMGRYLILGGLIAALMQTVLHQSTLLAVGQGPVLSVLVMIVLAVLLSICSTVDAFIALAFAGAFSGGSLLAFLVFGPMVDIKSTLMFLRVFKPRAVLYLVLLPLMMTVVVTVSINFFGRGW